MSEPICSYQRGVGWTLTPEDTERDHNGDLWRLEHRKPNPGEHGFNLGAGDSQFCKNGQPVMDKCKEHVRMCGFRINQRGGMYGPFRDDNNYITLILLEAAA